MECGCSPTAGPGAVVEDEDPARTTVVFLVFALVGDRWLVDGQIEIENPAAGTSAAGTSVGAHVS